MSGLLWALLVLPSAAGVLLALAGRAADRAAPVTGVVTAAGTLALALAAASGRPAAEAPLLGGMPAGFAVDGLSGLMAVTAAAVTTAVLVVSAAGQGPEEASARFFGLMLLFCGAMLVTVTADGLLVLLMGWEVMGAASWALIGHWWKDPERPRAANTAFLTTRTADLGLYLAAGAALAGSGAGTGGPALDALQQTADPWLSVLTAGIVVAALGKSAQLPFSFWLSRAMQGPAPVSALLHSATMVVAGAYLLLRTRSLTAASGWGSGAVVWAGAATAVLLGLVAAAQRDLKQLLAASSCAQIGFMVLAAGVPATTGGTLQLMAHAAAKSLAFLVAGVWLTMLGTRSLYGLRGAARRHPTAGVTFTVAAAALAGLPPLSLWAAKDVVLAAALQHSAALYAAGLSAAALSAVYSTKALWYVWQPAAARPPARLPLLVRAPLVLLGLACFALTPLAFPPGITAVGRALGARGPEPAAWEFVLSGTVAPVASALAWYGCSRRFRARAGTGTAAGRAWAADWLHLERAARLLLVRPLLRLAHALARFDDRVLDRAVTGTATATLRFAHWTDRRAEAGIGAAVGGIAAGTRAAGRWARRPQTGRLHQYLAQAVAAFTVLAVVLVLVR